MLIFLQCQELDIRVSLAAMVIQELKVQFLHDCSSEDSEVASFGRL